MPEFALPRTSVEIVEHGGLRYRLLLAWPAEAAPPAGYPVVYLLDADTSFGTMVETIRQRSRRADATGVPPTVVAGISPIVDVGDKGRRTRDFTPPGLVPPAGEWDAGDLPETGGGDRFLALLTGELRQRAEQTFAIDPERRTLFGHSLGGFFALHVLFSQPGSFRTFVAASPSIWWDVEGVMTRADRLAASNLEPAPRVLLTAGSHEQTIAPWQPASRFTEEVSARRERRRMVGHVLELGERLKPLTARGGAVEAVEFPGEDHASVVPLTISRAARFGPGLLER